MILPADFVDILKHKIGEKAVEGVLRFYANVPGRQPRKLDIELSDWLAEIDEKDLDFLRVIMTEAVQEALFRVTKMLDGVSLEHEELRDGSFALSFVKGDTVIKINNNDDFAQLSEYFRAE